MSYPILFGIVAATGGIPAAPTIGTVTITGTTASVPFTAPSDSGGSTITSYTAISTPGNITGTINQSGSGTITVSGLSLSTTYTFKVYATNSFGNSPLSSESNQASTPSIPITSGLLLFLDAGNTGSYPGSGTTWFDISGNGRNYTMVNTPTFVSAGDNSYFTNFADNIYFTGGTSYLPTGASPRTLISIARTPNPLSGYQHIAQYGTTNTGQSFGITTLGGSWNTHTWAGSYNPGAPNASTNTMYMASAGVQNSSTQWMWINTTAYSGGGSHAVNTGNSENNIGARIATSESWGNGRIYLYAMYDRLLSTSEITTFYNTYKTRFGLP
jgi:hypothetical protein